MANTYKLTINDIPEENKNLELTYNQDDGSTQTLSINNTNYKCTLNKFSYKKAIYQPGEIHIELQVGKESNAAISFSEVENIHNAFIGKFFQLQYTGKKTLNIAEDYYSFDVKIEKQGSGKPLTIQIQAFDPLKFLALDKYCMAYTCKKLIKDILINSAVWPNGIPKKLTDKLNSAQTTTEKIDKLKYDIYILNKEINDLKGKKQDATQKEKDVEKKIKEVQAKEEESFIITNPIFLAYTNNTDKTYTEFIQPYLVQYNESFLDFLVRVSNRCGEFFYYEGGKIHIGWEATDPIIIQEYVSVKFPQEIHTAWDNKAIADIHNDYAQGQNIINSATPKVMRDSELAFDENLAKIPPKEAYTSWQDFALFPGCFFVTNVTGALNSATLTEMIEFFIFNTTASITNSLTASSDTNNAYEKSNFDSDKPYFNERKNGNDLHPFSTNDTNKSVKSMTAYCLNFYTDIRNGIESAERSRLQIELGDHYCEVSLGSLIQFEGDTKQYIVVKIESQIDSQIDKLGLGGGETLSIEVILYNPDPKVTNYPPSAHVESIRSAKAQRAIITHNQDPLKMNRVRVRYPWQGETEKTEDLSKSEDSTPWIRIALPMASDGSGFNFLPEVGDEAIINYENGNIEKPYVEGMLYSSKKAVPASHKRNNARVLSSVNGHCIIFSDPGASTNAIKGLFPAWNTICSFYPLAKGAFENDDVRKAMGGIELTDEYGLYSISMSSEKRAISVDSPLGKVDINAFTGITISAPNGNVRIEGKNIDIVAGNNLSISSGNNIASHFWPFYREKGLNDSLSEFCKDVKNKVFLSKLELVDMNLLRTVFETFLRPCAGTLLIKSNRYLCFEAGKGEAQIAGRQVVKQLGLKETMDRARKFDQLQNVSIPYKNNLVTTNRIPIHINNLIQAINAANDAFKTTNAFLLREKNAYIDAYITIQSIFNSQNFITNGNQLPDFNTLYNNIGNFREFQMNDASISAEANRRSGRNPEPELQVKRFNLTKVYLNKLNKHALNIKDGQLTQNKIREKFKDTYIQDTVLKNLIQDHPTIYTHIDLLFNDSITSNYFTNNGPQNLRVANKRKLVFEILKLLITDQESTEVTDAAYGDEKKIELVEEPLSYGDYGHWKRFLKSIKYVDPPVISKKTKSLNILKSLGKSLIGHNKLEGMLDQYIWDTNEDRGKILFSDQEGETLNFHNKEVHYYKKSSTDPLNELKDILRGIQ